MNGVDRMGLVHDDQTIRVGTFPQSRTQEDREYKDDPTESFERGFEKFHICLDAKRGTLLEKNQMICKSALIGSQAIRTQK